MQRDTDDDWKKIGAGEPYYGVLTHERFLRGNLTSEVLSEFWQSGAEEVEYLIGQLRRQFGEIEIGRALDFGCGVGRLTRAMARFAGEVHGVDISPGMLHEASKSVPANVAFATTINAAEFDWINSIIVFQHIQPERGYAILDDLLARLKVGGVLSLQFTIYRDHMSIPATAEMMGEAVWDGAALRALSHALPPSGAMLMYDYDLTRVIAIAVRHGIEAFYIEHTNHGGYHGVRIFGRRQR